jgi:uncharacterized protein
MSEEQSTEPQGGPEPQEQPPVAQPVASGGDANTWAMFCHLAVFSSIIVPFGNIIGPLVVWLIKREEYAQVNDHGRESLNWQITLSLVGVIASAVCVPLIFIPIVGWFLIVLIVLGLVALAVFNIVVVILAAVKANNGEPYRYAFNLRLIK